MGQFIVKYMDINFRLSRFVMSYATFKLYCTVSYRLVNVLIYKNKNFKF